MLRFIDLTPDDWTDDWTEGPACAFLLTEDDRFVMQNGIHVFFSQGEIIGHPFSEEMLELLPERFFGTSDDGEKLRLASTEVIYRQAMERSAEIKREVIQSHTAAEIMAEAGVPNMLEGRQLNLRVK